jgi:hypothetical protein
MAPRKLTPQAAFNRVAKHLLAVVAHFGGDEAVEELLPLLEALQVVHDALAVEEWREALAGVADDFNLSPAVLEATP